MSKIVMITGAGGGLGQACTQLMSGNGWQVARVTRKAAGLDPSSEMSVVEADVSTPQGALEAVEGIRERYGEAPTGLVNCAGNILIAPLHRTKEAQYRECLRANLDSAFFSLSAFVNALIKEKRAGAAVLISSVAARIGIANHEAVAAAKGAIEALAQSAAATYSSKGIRINALAPGLMKSPGTQKFFVNDKAEAQLAAQYPLGRVGHLDDTAVAAKWLLSEEAQWITGQTLAVDGGFTSVRPMIRK